MSKLLIQAFILVVIFYYYFFILSLFVNLFYIHFPSFLFFRKRDNILCNAVQLMNGFVLVHIWFFCSFSSGEVL